jgi:long-chain acyl-CoA synthetase
MLRVCRGSNLAATVRLRSHNVEAFFPSILVSRRHGTNVAGSFYTENDASPGDKSSFPDQQFEVTIKPQSTLLDLWDQATRSFSNRRFIGTKMWVRGKLGYIWTTYESMGAEIDAMRTLLFKIGVSKGSRVIVISENRYEWVVVHVATLQLGGQFVCLPTNVTPEEARAVVNATQAKVLFVETTSSFNAVRNWAGEVGALEHVYCFEDQQSENSYAVAINLAGSVEEKAPKATNVTAEDTAMIMFTAGTTGPPKGVMLSHKNMVANVSSIHGQLGEAITPSDMFMSLCPWTVAGALTTELYQCLCKGAQLCIPPELAEGFQDLPIVNPSIIISVAQPFQRAYANIVDDVTNRGGLSRDLTKFTLGRITENRTMLQKPGRVLNTASSFFLGKFKRQFGEQLRIVVVIGHPLTKDQAEILADLDVFAVNTYGCLEAGGLIATDIDVPSKLKVLPGMEVRIVNEKSEIVAPGDIGEVLVEAPHAMQGYFDIHINPEEAKNAVVAYGARSFVRTGDYGSQTGGWIQIKGHKDVLINLNGGKVIDPLQIEATLTKSPFIRQVFVFGDNRPYLTALVVANSKTIASHLKKAERRDGLPIASEREKAECIRADIRRCSTNLPPRSQVRRFAIVEEFTLANGFVTSKYGYAREKIERHYVNYLNALYDETPKFFGYAVDDYDDLF